MSKSKTLTSNTAPEIRSIFSSNLRQLCDNYGPISQLSAELGINRTQFNRYLSGNSFPRPDVLFRICKFFGLDARILLEPLDSLQVRCSNIMFHSDLEEFFRSATDLASQSLPTGFYKFIRGSFIYDDLFTCGLFKVYQKDGCTFVRGFEPKEVFIKTGPALQQRPKGIQRVIHDPREWCGYVFLLQDVKGAHFPVSLPS